MIEQIVLLLLLVAVWGAFVLPSLLRREKPVTTRQRTAAASPVRGMASVERQRVLARRRTALVTLGFLAVATLGLAIITGSLPILILSLIIDVLLAGYIAILLQIKQGRSAGGGAEARRSTAA